MEVSDNPQTLYTSSVGFRDLPAVYSVASYAFELGVICIVPANLASVKAVAFEYEPSKHVKPLLQCFRMMVNHALWIGMHEELRGRFKLITRVYEDFKRYGLHTHYTLNACEVASALLKNHKGNHRAPVAKRLFLKPTS